MLSEVEQLKKSTTKYIRLLGYLSPPGYYIQ